MKSKSKVVVIGGGAVGVSTLYHLAKKGWSDVVLVERKELTSGSTWHAAGLLPLFNMSYSVGQLHKYAVKLYKTLEEETGQKVGFSVVSNIRLATTKDRMDEYYQYSGVAKTIGVDVKFLTPEQVKEIWPLCNTEGLIGAIQHPEDGYIQPADLTQALAKGARDKGAEIYRNTSLYFLYKDFCHFCQFFLLRLIYALRTSANHLPLLPTLTEDFCHHLSPPGRRLLPSSTTS